MAPSLAPQGGSLPIQAYITAAAVLTGALLGQVIGHGLALRREKLKERHVAHEKLFAPVVGDVIALLQASTTGDGEGANSRYQRGPRGQLWDDVLGHIRANISHARAELLRVALLVSQRPDRDAAWRYLRDAVFSLDPEYLAAADRLKSGEIQAEAGS